MMKRFYVISAFLLLSLHAERCIAASSLFDRLYDESEQSLNQVYPKGSLAKYIIAEMKRWHGKGITLTEDDLRAAVHSNLSALCTGKKDSNGDTILFAPGGATEDASCISFKNAIVALIDNEREALLLGNDLVSITSGAELSIADEGNRPVSIPRIAQLLYRLWSGNRTTITPWDATHDSKLQAVGTAFSNTIDPARTLQRFQHGYFRDKREQNRVYTGTGDDVRTALKDLAKDLDITGDQSRTGEWTVPLLIDAPDIGVWIRGDDLGLYQIYPTQYTSPKLERARKKYPALLAGSGTTLAHPFRYDGTAQAASRKSPLCSRFIGRYGYLCRPFTMSEQLCKDPEDPEKITLIACDDSFEEKDEPALCDGLKNIFTDNGKPLLDPDDPTKINDALTEADKSEVCSPAKVVMYQDDLAAHACYVSYCLAQTMKSHTLSPQRNPVLVNEMASPFLACMRDDPKLGTYIEQAKRPPYSLPPYRGIELILDLEQALCTEQGMPTHPVLGFCRYQGERPTSAPQESPLLQLNSLLSERRYSVDRQSHLITLTTIIGERVAHEQFLEVERKILTSLTTYATQISSLLLQLKNAPLTTDACPWTGPTSPVPPTE